MDVADIRNHIRNCQALDIQIRICYIKADVHADIDEAQVARQEKIGQGQ